MDRPINREKWPKKRIATLVAIIVPGVVALSVVLANSSRSQLSIPGERLTVAQVQESQFQEYVPISGVVQPNATVFLDLEEGGIVERIYVEGGNSIEKGALILSFSNTAAQKQNIEAETRLLDNLNQLRNSKINLTQSSLILKDQLLDLNFRIQELQRTFDRYQQLMKAPNSQLSKEQFESTRDQLQYLKDKRELLQQRISREAALQEQQSLQVDSSIKRVDKNLELLARIVDSLEVRAPISGQLSTLNAEIGQSFQRGQRIGQIDKLDSFKIRCDIDQYYISKVAVGQRGRFNFNGRSHYVEVVKIYPEVSKDVFQADLTFVESPPDGIKRGQTLQIDLGLSETAKTKIVAKGSFYRYTSGRWAYVLDREGRTARRTPIVVGRQNPEFVEVLQGLNVGDSIISSDYSSFNDVDELSFKESLIK